MCFSWALKPEKSPGSSGVSHTRAVGCRGAGRGHSQGNAALELLAKGAPSQGQLDSAVGLPLVGVNCPLFGSSLPLLPLHLSAGSGQPVSVSGPSPCLAHPHWLQSSSALAFVLRPIPVDRASVRRAGAGFQGVSLADRRTWERDTAGDPSHRALGNCCWQSGVVGMRGFTQSHLPHVANSSQTCMFTQACAHTSSPV